MQNTAKTISRSSQPSLSIHRCQHPSLKPFQEIFMYMYVHCTYFSISYAHRSYMPYYVPYCVPHELNLIRSNERKRNGCKIVNLPAPNISSLVQTGLETLERFKFELIEFTRITNLFCVRSPLPGTCFPFSDRLFIR